jgi:hypothetical protein
MPHFAPFSWLTSPFHSAFNMYSVNKGQFPTHLVQLYLFSSQDSAPAECAPYHPIRNHIPNTTKAYERSKWYRTSKQFAKRVLDEPLYIFHPWHQVDQTSLKRHGQVPRWHCCSNYNVLTTSSLPDLAVCQQFYSHWHKSCARRGIVQWTMEELLARLTKYERE